MTTQTAATGSPLEAFEHPSARLSHSWTLLMAFGWRSQAPFVRRAEIG